MDLALNNLQWLICHKTKPNKTKLIVLIQPIYIYIYIYKVNKSDMMNEIIAFILFILFLMFLISFDIGSLSEKMFLR